MTQCTGLALATERIHFGTAIAPDLCSDEPARFFSIVAGHAGSRLARYSVAHATL